MMRSLFLKLASLLDFPLVRIGQCGSSDLVSVSEFYSQLLVRYARGVLEIVPKNMFGQVRGRVGLGFIIWIFAFFLELRFFFGFFGYDFSLHMIIVNFL